VGQGDIDGAIADYNRAIEFNPKFTHACYNRGVAKGAKGDIDGAIATTLALSNSIERCPCLQRPWRCQAGQGRSRWSHRDCTRVIELNPKKRQRLNNRGASRAFKGDVVGAIADVNRAIELDPKLTAAYYNRATQSRAQATLTGLLRLHARHRGGSRCARCYYNRGGCYFNKQQYDAAIKDLQRLLNSIRKRSLLLISRLVSALHRKPHEFDCCVSQSSGLGSPIRQ